MSFSTQPLIDYILEQTTIGQTAALEGYQKSREKWAVALTLYFDDIQKPTAKKSFANTITKIASSDNAVILDLIEIEFAASKVREQINQFKLAGSTQPGRDFINQLTGDAPEPSATTQEHVIDKILEDAESYYSRRRIACKDLPEFSEQISTYRREIAKLVYENKYEQANLSAYLVLLEESAPDYTAQSYSPLVDFACIIESASITRERHKALPKGGFDLGR